MDSLIDMRELSATELGRLDEHIFHKNILVGIAFLKDLLQISLPEAQDLFSERYQSLRKSNGNRFTVSEKEYWQDFYS